MATSHGSKSFLTTSHIAGVEHLIIHWAVSHIRVPHRSITPILH